MSAIPSLPAVLRAQIPNHDVRELPAQLDDSTAIKGLAALIQRLDAFDSAIALDDLHDLMGRLVLDGDDLQAFTLFDACNYRRNQIRCTDTYELVLICWRPDQESPIHDHAGSACVFRVLEGTGIETVYEPRSEAAASAPDETFPLVPSATSCHCGGALCASFDADVHKVSNPGPGNLCTLHVYSPPLRDMRIYEGDVPVS